MRKPSSRAGQIRHGRTMRRWAAAAACLAVLSSSAAVPQAAAAPGTPDASARYQACAGPAEDGHEFTDVAAGSAHDAAIGCISYYKITFGTTADMFAPQKTITRGQLAQMLARAAVPAGINLPSGSADGFDQGFVDVPTSSSSWLRINQISWLGIMSGADERHFKPRDPVTRVVIVEALARFLAASEAGTGGGSLRLDSATGEFSLRASGDRRARLVTVDERFPDIASVTAAQNQAVRHLAEMGVVAGRSDGTFGPGVLVTRAQAASFITRALAHTMTRPAGLVLQYDRDSKELGVSLRGADFRVKDDGDQLVDFFQHPAGAAAFGGDGGCKRTGSAAAKTVGGGRDADICVIDVGDRRLDNGDATVLLDPPRAAKKEITVWAWTGEPGASFKRNPDADTQDSVEIAAEPNAAKVSLDTSQGGNKAPYGRTVKVTIQMVGSDGDSVAVSGKRYTWSAAGVSTTVGGGIDRQERGIGSTEVATDEQGRAQFALPMPRDPKPGSSGNKTTWTYTIQPAPGSPSLESDVGIGFTVEAEIGTGKVEFSDGDPAPHSLKFLGAVNGDRSWQKLQASGDMVTSEQTVVIQVEVRDQFGDPYQGASVYFDRDGGEHFGCSDPDASPSPCAEGSNPADPGDSTIDDEAISGADRAKSNWKGVARFYVRAGDRVDNRIITYMAAVDTGGARANTIDTSAMSRELVDGKFYWTLEPAADAQGQPLNIPASDFRDVYIVDLDKNVLVYDGNGDGNDTEEPRRWEYRDGDSFRYSNGDGSDNVRNIEEVAEFEARIDTYLRLEGNNGLPRDVTMRRERKGTGGASIFYIRLPDGSDLGGD